ncbi:MAG: YihY/virulence factor BrkB family protein [Caldimonas sp.]
MMADSEAPHCAPEGWRSLITRICGQISDDRLPVIAAGVAFYGLLALFPTLVAIVSTFGLAFDPDDMQRHVASLSQLFPDEVAVFVRKQLIHLTNAGSGALGLGAAGSVVIALWSTSSGMRTLMQALNVAYDLKEQRGLFARIGVSLLLAAMMIFGMLIAMTAIVLLPIVSSAAELGRSVRGAIGWLRWPIVAASFWVGLILLYRYGPHRPTPRWFWMNWGAAVAVVIWLVVSLLFSVYVSRFGTFNRAYGSMGAVVVLMLWFLLTAWAVLIGAEVNATLQQQPTQTDGAE